MARNTSISLGDHFTAFIERQLAGGRYGSASDVIRAGLRLLEQQELERQALCAAGARSEESRPPPPSAKPDPAPRSGVTAE